MKIKIAFCTIADMSMFIQKCVLFNLIKSIDKIDNANKSIMLQATRSTFKHVNSCEIQVSDNTLLNNIIKQYNGIILN